MGELVDETILSGDEVLIINVGRVGRSDNEVIKALLGEFSGGNIGEDIKEVLVVDKQGRRVGEDGDEDGGDVTGVSRGWEVPSVVGAVEEVLDLLGGGGEVGCVDVID